MLDPEDIAVTLAQHSGEITHLSERVETLERQTSAINKLATATEVMAKEIEVMGKNIAALTKDVSDLKAKPGKRWDGIVEKALLVIVGAIVAFALSKIGF